MNTKVSRIAMLLATVFVGAAGHANAYTSIDLGTLGGANSAATAINNDRRIVGFSDAFDLDASSQFIATHATLWVGMAVIDMDPGSGPNGFSKALGINNSGQVVGNGYSAGLYSFLGADSPVHSINGMNGAYTAVNNGGTTAGWTMNGLQSQATVWSGSNSTVLNNLPNGNSSNAIAINDAGQVVGSATFTASTTEHATRWDGVNATDLGTLGGYRSYAYDINNAGQVVGIADDANHQVRAVIWNGDTIHDLGSLYSHGNYAASAINESGQVVGSFDTGASNSFDARHAILWNGGAMVDLDNLLAPRLKQEGWVFSEATGINDSGEIVGNMRNRYTAAQHAVLLSAVPEPETYAMLLAGLGLLGFMARRRQAA